MRSVAVRALAWAAAGLVVLVLALTVVLPRIGGGSTYTILTGSMRPSLPPGTVVVVRPTPAEKIRTGDVITFQLRSGDPTVATHRVRSVGVSAGGELRFVTQGDANDAPDVAVVRPVQIKGVVWYSVPWAGYPSLKLGADVRQVAVMSAVGLLGAYAVTMVASDVRDRRRRRTTPAETVRETARELTGVDS
ncbi:MAG: signal peptidase I [Nocardioidaceae bacterium]|nr:signal peptidase I [Nocardioidaceae bacterium]